MIQFSVKSLGTTATSQLATWQKEINDLSDYQTKVEEGKKRFRNRNKRQNTTFLEIRTTLSAMGSGHCAYCEHSEADEVEHFLPQTLYPEAVFSWDNYLYACGPCNGPKNDKFAIVSTNPVSIVSVARRHDAPVVPPIPGSPALINPRSENPLDFLFLDFVTFRLDPVSHRGAIVQLRGEYTRDVLRLNRDYLLQQREDAYTAYVLRLKHYISWRAQNISNGQFHYSIANLSRLPHRTVWKEMQRQQVKNSVLSPLFSAAPEALHW